MKFKNFYRELYEETTSGDIATVDTKLVLSKKHPKRLQKNKKCKKHNILNCPICTPENKWK